MSWRLTHDLSINLALLGRMTMDVLKCGSCESLKAGVHATALGLVALMGLYNAAAWLTRREQHLAINAVLYALLAAWEQKHVAHHVAELHKPRTREAAARTVEPDATRLAA